MTHSTAEGNSSENRKWIKEAITPLNFFTFLLVIVAGLQAWILKTTDDTLIDTLQTNRSTQRAFIYPTLVQTYLSPDPINAPNFVNFLFSLNNSGNTASKNLGLRIGCVPAAQSFADPWILLAQQKQTPSVLIAPHAGQTIGCSFPIAQIKDMTAGKLFGYILIEVTYEDRLSTHIQRVSQYAVQLAQVSFTPAVTDGQTKIPAQIVSALVNVGKHNCADDECPK